MNQESNNIHIYRAICFLSLRIYKIAETIKELNIYDNIILLGINDGDLPVEEKLKGNISIYRLDIQTNK